MNFSRSVAPAYNIFKGGMLIREVLGCSEQEGLVRPAEVYFYLYFLGYSTYLKEIEIVYECI